MAQMMESIMRMPRGKRITDGIGLVNTVSRTQRVTEGLMYNLYHLTGHAMLEASTHYYPIPPMVSTLQETCPPPLAPIPSRGVYIYPYVPHPVVPSPSIT